jgi:hypothetical protein
MTRHKINEARFFLQHAETSIDRPIIFSYYLSAFVSAARSSTFVLKYEIGKDHEFKNWYAKKQDLMNKDAIFSFFNSVRIETIHHEGKIKFRRKISLGVIEAEVEQPDRKIEMYFDDEQWTKRNGIEMCDEYFNKLSALVDSAEKLFG